MGTISHAKTSNVTDWTQAQLDVAIAAGQFAAGTTLADIVLPSDWNAAHTINLTTADVPDSSNKRYVTDAQLTVIGNTSGTNTGDQTLPTPGGSGTEVQYRSGASTFGAMAGTAWDNTNRAEARTGATVTTSNPVQSFTQTWNAGAVTFTGWKLNITNTASAAASLFADFQLAGTSTAYLKRTGVWGTVFNGGTAAFVVEVSGQNAVGTGRNGTLGGLSTFDGSTAYQNVRANEVSFSSGVVAGWWSGGVGGGSLDAAFNRNGTGVIAVLKSTTTSDYGDLKLRNVVGQTGYHEMIEMTAPAAGAANTARLFIEDNGAGKTRLMVQFATGAAQQIAIEP